MKKKMNFSRVVSAHLRGMKELHKASHQLFPTLILCAVLKGIIPYVTVFFSAQILSELSEACRADILWKWVFASVAAVGILSALKAVVQRRYDALFDDFWGRKEILFCLKSFSMDYADIDNQTVRDKRTQLFQNANWAGWGLGRITQITEHIAETLVGISGGITLTVSLFTTAVPAEGGKLTVLNNPVFVILLAAVLISICFISGKLSEKVVVLYSSASDKA